MFAQDCLGNKGETSNLVVLPDASMPQVFLLVISLSFVVFIMIHPSLLVSTSNTPPNAPSFFSFTLDTYGLLLALSPHTHTLLFFASLFPYNSLTPKLLQ